MKHINKGIALSVIIAVFVLFGSIGIFWKAGYLAAAHSYHFLKKEYSTSQYFSNLMDVFNDNICNIDEKLLYHSYLMDINSVNLRLSGVSIIPDKDIIKEDNCYLAFYEDKLSKESINKSVSKINELYQFANANGIPFMYVACPIKGYINTFPSGIENNIASNCNKFYVALNSAGIPSLILQDKLFEDSISEEDAFFITDHHWKPTTGLWATGKLLQALNNSYGLDYNKDYCDINNYNITTYKDFFLGSQGKKVGQYYSELGIDDFDLITPKFSTSITESQPLKDEIREGAFSDTVIYSKHLENKGLYNNSPYYCYSGGDYRLQIIDNNNFENGKTVLVLRDSYGSVVTPFLSLHFNTLYSVDLREADYIPEKQINIYETINKYKPDYIVVVFSGIPDESRLNY